MIAAIQHKASDPLWIVEQGDFAFLLEKIRDVDLCLSLGPLPHTREDVIWWQRVLTLLRPRLQPTGNAVFVLTPSQAHRLRKAADMVGWEYYELICPSGALEGQRPPGRPVYTHWVVIVLPHTFGLSIYQPLPPRAGASPLWRQGGSILPEEAPRDWEYSVFALSPGPTLNQLEALIQMYAPKPAIIADPFARLGAVGVAAMLQGRYYLGAEEDPRWAERANQILHWAWLEAFAHNKE